MELLQESEKSMKIKKRLLAVCIAIPLLVGVVSAFLTRNSMAVFESVEKPPFCNCYRHIIRHKQHPDRT